MLLLRPIRKMPLSVSSPNQVKRTLDPFQHSVLTLTIVMVVVQLLLKSLNLQSNKPLQNALFLQSPRSLNLPQTGLVQLLHLRVEMQLPREARLQTEHLRLPRDLLFRTTHLYQSHTIVQSLSKIIRALSSRSNQRKSKIQPVLQV